MNISGRNIYMWLINSIKNRYNSCLIVISLYNTEWL